MQKEDKIMLGGALVLAIIVMETIIFGGLGLGVVIGVMAYFGCLGLFSKLYEKKMTKVARWLLIPIILCRFCFILFSNTILRCFNLLVIILLNWVVEAETGKKSIYAKGLISFITTFTLFMVICALSKMFMYMQKFGLSLWRVYVAWFLVLSLLIVLVVFVKVFWQKIQVIKVVFILFTVMYLGLNYSNVDYFIASQNVSLYEQSIVSDLSGCYNLSTSAMGPIQKLVLAHPEVLQDNGEENAYKATGIIDRLEHNLENKKWQDWNVADYRANQGLKEIK